MESNAWEIAVAAILLLRGFVRSGIQAVQHRAHRLPQIVVVGLLRTRAGDAPLVSFIVAMAVVDVGIMRMAVRESRMRVFVRMRLNAVPGRIVRMLVMFIMHVMVRVLRRFVGMCVLVTLGEVQPDTSRHERGGNPERHRGRFAEGQDCYRGADEGSR